MSWRWSVALFILLVCLAHVLNWAGILTLPIWLSRFTAAMAIFAGFRAIAGWFSGWFDNYGNRDVLARAESAGE